MRNENNLKFWKNIVLTMAFCVILCVSLCSTLCLSVSNVFATEYWISPTGAGLKNGTSSSNAWDSFATAQATLSPGDKLWLISGVYTHSVNGMMIITVSGTSGLPITFQAVTDGGAIIDAEGSDRKVVDITGTGTSDRKKYLNFEGLVFYNNLEAPIVSGKFGEYINFKRCLAYGAVQASANAIWSFDRVNNSLLEDCLSSGKGRKNFMFIGSDFATMRRCVGLFHSEPAGNEGGVSFNLYGCDDSIIENCVHLPAPGATQVCDWPFLSNGSSAALNGNRNKILGCYTSGGEIGFGMHAQEDSTRMVDGLIKDCVSLSPLNTGSRAAQAARLRDQSSATYNKNTLVLTEDWTPSYAMRVDATTTNPDGWINGDIKNTSMLSSTGKIGFSISTDSRIGTITHTYNNLYGFTTPYSGTTAGTGEIAVNPVYDTATYGNGAYLMVPTALQGVGEGGEDIGAEILYRYVDGTLTTTPLWPLPMDALILSKTGVSPTYAANGGIWTTLSGVYGGSPPGSPGMSTPTPGSTFTGAEETFTWDADGEAVSKWWLYLGSSVGGLDIYDSGNLGTATSHVVSVLPVDGSPVYARLFYRIGTDPWENNDYTYTAYTSGGGGGTGTATLSLAPTKDTYIQSNNPTFNYGGSQFGTIRWDGTQINALHKFDFSAMSGTETITSAKIHKYNYTQTGGSGYIGLTAYIRRLTETGWTEGTGTGQAVPGANWTQYDGTSSWAVAGGDFTTTYQGTTTLTGTETWHIYDVTDMAIWCSTNTAQTMDVINMYNANTTFSHVPWFRSREYTTDPSIVTKLVIDYEYQMGTETGGGGGGSGTSTSGIFETLLLYK